jgi:hypothetical protein
MIRNLKVLLAAAMALAAFGAIAASGASAAEYHCTVEPCRVTLKPDGTAKTAHHVFIVRGKNGAGEAVSGSFTCSSLDGEGTSLTKTTKELTIINLNYTECNIAGTPVTVHMNGCDYHFVSGPPSTVTIKCPAGKQIELTILSAGVLKCTVDVPAQTLGGITYHDANTGGVPKTELTVETAVKDITGINATAAAGGSCIPFIGFNGVTAEGGEYTTGNTIITGETTAGVHGGVWYE